MVAFDTHQAVRRLTASGMEVTSAEAIVDVLNHATRELVTKDDLELAVARLTAEMHRALRVQAAWIVGMLTGLATIAAAMIAIAAVVVGIG